MKIGIKIAMLCLFVLAFPKPIQAGTITIGLDLTLYDTFNETIDMEYSGPDMGIVSLNEFNGYKKTLEWFPGTYNINLSVRNDSLHVIQLQPAQLTVTVENEEYQEILIQVTDSGGLGSGANDYIHSEVETATQPIEAFEISAKIYEWGEETERVGILKITVPDITGMKDIIYSLQDEMGKIYSYVLYKENNFTAEIQLPYGKYTETGNPELTAEDGIIIPTGTVFEYGYYQDSFGKTYDINEKVPYQENPSNMKLLLILPDGESIEIRNLYWFSGNQAILSPGAGTVETGHFETQSSLAETLDNGDTASSNPPMGQHGEQAAFIIPLTCFVIGFLVICVIVFRVYFNGGKKNGE